MTLPPRSSLLAIMIRMTTGSLDALRQACRAPRGTWRRLSMFPKHQRPRLPKVLNTDQLLSLFQALRSPKYRAILMTCYAAGLRLGEACRLQIGDIDSSRMVIHVRQGKGNKERYTVLSPRLLHAAGLLEAISAHHVVVFRAAPKK